MSLPLMIFAAGFGTRMGALTRDRPKPLVEVAGHSLMARAIALGREAGCAPLVANTHYLGHMLSPLLAAEGVAESREEGPILDTGGGLRKALPLLGAGRVLTLNPDAVWTGANPLSSLANGWREGAMEGLLMFVPRAAARAHDGPGDAALDGSGRVVWRAEDTAPLVYAGAQLLDTAQLPAMPDGPFGLMALWRAMAARDTLFGVVHEGGWADVGTPAGIAAAEAMLAEAGVP